MAIADFIVLQQTAVCCEKLHWEPAALNGLDGRSRCDTALPLLSGWSDVRLGRPQQYIYSLGGAKTAQMAGERHFTAKRIVRSL